MTTQAIEVTNTDAKHADSDDLGTVHITGAFISGTETLCGNVDTGTGYAATSQSVTCAACAEIYQSIKKSRKRLTFNV